MISLLTNFLIELWKDESGGSDIGRLGLVIGGAALGFALGGPLGAAAFGAQLGVLAGTIAGNILFPQELPDIVGPRLDPNQSMTSAYGDPVAIVYGRVVVGGRVAWYPGFVEHVLEEEAGGKGGPTQTTISYTYTGSFRVNCCEGPIGAILKIWHNRKLIYDVTTDTDPIIDWATVDESPGTQAIRIYLGTETQNADIAELEDKGVDATPAYRGLAGVVFENWPLDDFGAVLPQVTMLVATAVTETLAATSHTTGGSGAYWIDMPSLGRIAISHDTIWDNVAQRVFGTATSPAVSSDPLFPIVDGEGNLWSVGRSRSITKYDAESLLSLGTGTLKDPLTGGGFGNDSLHWEDHIVFGGFRTPEGVWVGERLLFLQAATPVACFVSNLDEWQGDFGGVINIFSVPNAQSEALIVDNDRFAWFMEMNVGGVSNLHRVNPGDGRIDKTLILDAIYNVMTYDRWTNSIIVLDLDSHMARINLDTEVEDARFTFVTNFPVNAKNLSLFRQGPRPNGDMYMQVTETLGLVSVFNLRDEMSNPGPEYTMSGDFGLGSSTTHRGFYDESRNSMMKRNDITGAISYLFVGRFGEGDLITVQSIVDDMADRVGFAPADTDTSALTDQLHGFISGSRQPAKAALAPLSQMFFFNPVSEDFQVKFVLLGGSSVATIPEDDLGAGGGGGPRVETDPVMEEFIQEIELPEVMELGYNNPKDEYQAQYQRVKRPRTTTNSLRQKRFQFPGSFLSNADAHQRIETILYNTWTKRRPLTFTTAQRWMRLSPGDVVTVEFDGTSTDVTLGNVDIGANNVIEFKGAGDDPSTLISIAHGAEGDQGQVPQVIEIAGPSEFFVLDIPLLRAQDDGFIAYLAAGPFSTGITFQGTDFRQSLDGSAYGNFGFVSRGRAATHGFATATLAGGVDDGLWDRTNTLSVQTLFGTLASSTEDAVLDGANSLLVGNEIVCFVTANDLGDGRYDLTQLLRGRRGTEGEIDNHVAAEKVIVLGETTLVRRAMDLSQVNVAFFYKGVSVGAREESSLRKTFTMQGKSQWGWAVVHVAGSIAADDWTIGWTRRSILSPEWRNLEASPAIVVDAWEVDILDAPGGTVKATYTEVASANGSVVNASANTFFYDNNDQIADLGGVQTTVTFKIYALTDNIGRGFPQEVTLVEGLYDLT